LSFYYRISGLSVASEFPLPGAVPAAAILASETDVTVRRVREIPTLQAPQILGPNWAIDGDRFVLRVPRVANFLVTAGRDIAMQIEAGVAESDAVVFLLGTAFGVLLYQRGRIVLHASAVQVGDSAVLFCGKSGAGKSTIAAALNKLGYAHVTDDVCCIDFDMEGCPVVLSDGRMLKLWLDAVTEIDLGDRKGDAVRSMIDKFYVDPAVPLRAPAPRIAAIYALREQRAPLEVGIETPGLLDATQILRRGLYRARLMATMGLSGTFLAKVMEIQRRAGVYYLTRPFNMAAMPDVTSRLEAHWQALGLIEAVG
jgi:energy-coupling factor transporter ATP-binding protein EcfA2